MRADELAAEIMTAMRQAKFPKDHPAEAHDEFEALVLTPMLEKALTALSPRPLSIDVEAVAKIISRYSGAGHEHFADRWMPAAKAIADAVTKVPQ